jgi:preflagellin peptidase FlaK
VAVSDGDWSSALDAARLLVGLVALAIASMTDVRTRRVPNVVWYGTAAAGAGLLVADLAMVDGGGAWAVALAFPVAAVFAVVVTGGELWPVMPDDDPDPGRELTRAEARVYVADIAASGFLLAASVAVMFLASRHLDDPAPLWRATGSVTVILLALALYYLRLLHGGGDAKALMTLAVLFPTAPLAGGAFPLIALPPEADMVFPFALVVLIDAALLVVLIPVVFLAMSAMRGPLRLPEALFGHPVPVEAYDERRMWLLHEAGEDGTLRRHLWPRRSKAAAEARARALEAFRARGDAMVYVSPKLPFMVPMLGGLLVATVVGNIVMGLMWALAGL